MRQIREVLRLHHEGHLSERQIARGCRLSRSTVQRYLERAADANLRWPLPEALDDTQLERLLFPPPAVQATSQGRPAFKRQPDFAGIHQELKANKSVTLQLLWQEFLEHHPEGVHYSWFCQQYRDSARHLDVVLRQDHRAGGRAGEEKQNRIIAAPVAVDRSGAANTRVTSSGERKAGGAELRYLQTLGTEKARSRGI